MIYIDRSSDASDMELIREMGEEWFAATGFEGEMSWEHMVNQTQMLLDLGGYFGLAFYEDNSPTKDCIGGLLGLASPDPFTGQLGAHELAWYIDPAYRSRGAASILLDDFESWAVEAGCETCHMISLTSSPPELGQYFKGRGYRPIETRFRKTLTKG